MEFNSLGEKMLMFFKSFSEKFIHSTQHNFRIVNQTSRYHSVVVNLKKHKNRDTFSEIYRNEFRH